MYHFATHGGLVAGLRTRGKKASKVYAGKFDKDQ